MGSQRRNNRSLVNQGRGGVRPRKRLRRNTAPQNRTKADTNQHRGQTERKGLSGKKCWEWTAVYKRRADQKRTSTKKGPKTSKALIFWGDAPGEICQQTFEKKRRKIKINKTKNRGGKSFLELPFRFGSKIPTRGKGPRRNHF